MAETAKILNPEKKVLLPDLKRLFMIRTAPLFKAFMKNIQIISSFISIVQQRLKR